MGTITTNVKLIETDSDFLEKVSHKISVSGENWYYMPFWYKKIAENVYQQVDFKDLPPDVISIIQKNREK
jgi:hypothetical protein